MLSVDRDLGQPGAEAQAIAACLHQQRVGVAAMAVPDDRRRLVGQRVSGCQDTEEHVDVLSPARSGTRTQRLVEAAEAPDRFAADGEVGSGTVGADLKGEERQVMRRVVEGVHPGAHGVRPGHPPVEVRLGPGAQFAARDHAADAGDVGVAGESACETAQPAGIGDDVIVGEGDDLVPGGGESAVARRRQPGDRLHHATEPRIVDLLDHVGGGRSLRRVVDDDHLEVGVVDRAE